MAAAYAHAHRGIAIAIGPAIWLAHRDNLALAIRAESPFDFEQCPLSPE